MEVVEQSEHAGIREDLDTNNERDGSCNPYCMRWMTMVSDIEGYGG